MCFRKYRVRRLTKKIIQLQQNRQSHQVKDAMIAKEIKYYHKLSKLYTKLHGNKHFPFALEMSRECLRIAAQLEDMNAQYLLGLRYIEEGKWREHLEHEKHFASQANQNLMEMAYKQGLAYLSAAEKNGHALAKRLRGLCYIYGWGVPQDKETGFSMVIESIASENSWDKAPQILASIGLNKPEFYEALVKAKQRGV